MKNNGKNTIVNVKDVINEDGKFFILSKCNVKKIFESTKNNTNNLPSSTSIYNFSKKTLTFGTPVSTLKNMYVPTSRVSVNLVNKNFNGGSGNGSGSNDINSII